MLTVMSPLGVPSRLRKQPRLCSMADRAYIHRYFRRYGHRRLLRSHLEEELRSSGQQEWWRLGA
jgi:hypothetical protein